MDDLKTKLTNALKWVDTTTVEVDKIADFYGLTGQTRAKFLKAALAKREKNWGVRK